MLYGQIITRLWVAHGAAAGIIISVVSTHADRKYNQMLWVLPIFLMGLGLLALSDLLLIVRDAKVVKRYQSAFSILDVLSQDVEAPLDRIGLKGFRYKAQIWSAGFFVAGLILGFLVFAKIKV